MYCGRRTRPQAGRSRTETIMRAEQDMQLHMPSTIGKEQNGRWAPAVVYIVVACRFRFRFSVGDKVGSLVGGAPSLGTWGTCNCVPQYYATPSTPPYHRTSPTFARVISPFFYCMTEVLQPLVAHTTSTLCAAIRNPQSTRSTPDISTPLSCVLRPDPRPPIKGAYS